LYLVAACACCAPRGSGTPPGAASGQAAAANESADEFVTRVNGELTARAQEAQAAGFTLDVFITPDTQLLNARANDRYLAYLSKAVAEARRYDTQNSRRRLHARFMKLRLNVAAPAPDDARKPRAPHAARGAARSQIRRGQVLSDRTRLL